MTVSATLGGVFLKGTAAARPAADAVAGGTVYSATDTGAITQSDGSSWSTWATISTGLADPMTTRGDIIARLAAGTGRLALGAAGQVPRSDGTDVLYAYPPGHQFDYAQVASGTNLTNTSAATAHTLITGASVAYDGATEILIEAYAYAVQTPASLAGASRITLWEDGTDLGRLGDFVTPAAAAMQAPLRAAMKRTPSAASHTYSIRGYVDTGTGIFRAGAGGAGAATPAFMRITKV